MNMFSAKKEEAELDPCCLRRMACEGLCGASMKFCDDEMKKCVEGTCAARAAAPL